MSGIRVFGDFWVGVRRVCHQIVSSPSESRFCCFHRCAFRRGVEEAFCRRACSLPHVWNGSVPLAHEARAARGIPRAPTRGHVRLRIPVRHPTRPDSSRQVRGRPEMGVSSRLRPGPSADPWKGLDRAREPPEVRRGSPRRRAPKFWGSRECGIPNPGPRPISILPRWSREQCTTTSGSSSMGRHRMDTSSGCRPGTQSCRGRIPKRYRRVRTHEAMRMSSHDG